MKKLLRYKWGLLLLAVGIALLVWAIQTQYLDIRNRAVNLRVTCWNRVITQNDQFYWPDGCKGNPSPNMLCSQAIVALTASETNTYTAWVNDGSHIPAACGTGETTPAPTLSGGCYYQQVQCVRAPCNPVLVCPPDTNTCDGADGSLCFASRCPTCTPGSRVCPMSACIQYDGVCQNHRCLTAFLSPTPTTTPAATLTITPSPTPSRTPTPTMTLTPSPSMTSHDYNIDIFVRFAGVTDGKADGAKATIRFINGSLDLVTSPRAFTHVASGIYKTTLSLTSNQLPSGPGYVIIVKGEKHLARKFCKMTDQMTACQPTETITLPAPTGQKTTFTFTGLPLDPGDLPAQDGKADLSDFAKIKDRMNISCSQLTAEDKHIADINYSGCVDSMDAYWMRHTLETRYDEN